MDHLPEMSALKTMREQTHSHPAYSFEPIKAHRVNRHEAWQADGRVAQA